MKDIKSVEGNRFISETTLNTDDEVLAVTVRNKSANGRRLGIFSKNNSVVVGQQIHQADALHTPMEIQELPAGYVSGKELNLSPKRNYFKIFSGNSTALLAAWKAGSDEFFHTDSNFNAGSPKLSNVIPEITKSRLSVSSGDFNVGETKITDNLNRFVSFSFVFVGTAYHIGLDLGKHPAVVTAELNYRLNRIHPTLRGFVAIESKTGNTADYGIYFTAPDNLDVIFPLTTFPIKGNLCRKPQVGASFNTGHLNNTLSSAILLNRNGTQNTTNTITSVTGPAIASAASMIASPYEIDTTAFSHPPEAPTSYTGRATVPANAFKTWDKDHRLNIVVIKIKRNFVDGRVFKFNSIRYIDEANQPLNYDHAFADILVIPAPYSGVDVTSSNSPAVFIDELSSEDEDNFIGYKADLAKDIQFAESGNLNEAEAGAYLVLLPRPTEDSRNSIFFRNTNLPTRLEINYELVEAEQVPSLKFEDIGDVDYHKVLHVENSLLPLSFMATPITDWGLDFITEGQTGRFSAYQFDADEQNGTVRMLTQGTVDETVLVSGLNFAEVQAPVVGIDNYHINKQLGCQSWLTLNLLPTGVVTHRQITAEKSNYRVIFPTEVMDVNTVDPVAVGGLNSSQTDGTVPVSGRFANSDLDTLYGNKGALLNTDEPTWEFTAGGINITPSEAVVFNKATGVWSTRFNVVDLVSPGPGTPIFRANLTVKYPWLASNTTYTATQQYQVRPAVEGVEDDVTFITEGIYGASTSEPVAAELRIVDLDSGEILAEGNTVAELEADALAKGLVDIELIYGQADIAPLQTYFSLTPNGAPITSVAEGQYVYLNVISSNPADNGQVFTLEYPVTTGSTDENDFEEVPPPPPANDLIANAAMLSGDSGSLTATNVGATNETFLAGGAGDSSSSIWYKWIPTVSGTATISLVGSDFDTLIGIYTSPTEPGTGESLEFVTGDDDSGGNTTSLVTSAVVAGSIYYIAVSGYNGSTGNINMTWSIS